MSYDFFSDDSVFYDVGDFALNAVFYPSTGSSVNTIVVLSSELFGKFGEGNPYVPDVVPEVKNVAMLSVGDVGIPNQGDKIVINDVTYVIDYIVTIDELDVEVVINEA